MTFDVPNLPGTSLSRPHPSPRKKGLGVVNGVRIDASIADQSPRIGKGDDVEPLMTTYQRLTVETRKPTLATAGESALPLSSPKAAFLKYDKQVLRFYAYFTEEIPESRQESKRVRKLTLYYYLENDTVEITEPKFRDSGMPQGTFLKRMPLPNAEKSGSFHWRDLHVGQTISVYGRLVRIYDADEFTRKFFGEHEIVLADKEGAPEDTYSKIRATATKGDSRASCNPINKEMKAYMEAQMGNSARSQNAGAKQYLQHCGKVLSFEAEAWEKTGPGGQLELNDYTLNYYLADDTIEIKEKIDCSSGKDPFPLALKKQRLRKDWKESIHLPGAGDRRGHSASAQKGGALLVSPSGEAGPTESEEERRHAPAYPAPPPGSSPFYLSQDLFVGADITVFGRCLRLVDADGFTRRHYQHEWGVDLAPAMYTDRQKPPMPRSEVPPHNGIGSEEDSLGNCHSLVPRPPKKDMNKLFKYDRVCLNFKAKLISSRPENDMRSFVIRFYPADDTIGIYEPEQRNSGFVGGKFLERGKHLGADGQRIACKDLAVGSVVVISSHKFTIVGTDEFTSQFLEKEVQKE